MKFFTTDDTDFTDQMKGVFSDLRNPRHPWLLGFGSRLRASVVPFSAQSESR